MKAKQNGYYKLPSGQYLHFSTNCWFNLLEDTGKQVDQFGLELQAEFDKDKVDVLKVVNLLTDLAFAAAKAHDQEEGIEISYNRFKVRDWVSQLKDTDSEEFMAAMTASIQVPIEGN